MSHPGGWNAENTAELKRLVELGMSGSEIARLFGFTKNAVIGRAYRLGFKLGAHPASSPRGSAQHGLSSPPAPRKAAQQPSRPRQTASHSKGSPKIATTEFSRPWTERKWGECSWLLTEGADGIACCAPVERAGWCAAHARIGCWDETQRSGRKKSQELIRSVRHAL